MSIRAMFPSSGAGKEAVRAPVSLLQRDLNRLFEDFFPGFELSSFPTSLSAVDRRTAGFSPSLDVHETENEYVVHAELPGVEEKDIDLSLKENHLIIRGEKRSQIDKTEGEGRRYVERSYGSFQRVIPLAVDVDEDAIDASFAKGVLTVKLPKSKVTKADHKKISVRAQ